MIPPNYPYRGTIGWEPFTPTKSWNDICADVVEQFGLPGDRYVTSADFYSMDFYFRTEQDLLLFKLQWSEYEL